MRAGEEAEDELDARLGAGGQAVHCDAGLRQPDARGRQAEQQISTRTAWATIAPMASFQGNDRRRSEISQQTPTIATTPNALCRLAI